MTEQRERAHRAVTVGVTRFRDPDTGQAAADLDFSAELVPELARVLRELGYETAEFAERELAGEKLGGLIADRLRTAGPRDVLLVHVVSHGRAADGAATVHVLGSDGVAHESADVGHWLVNLQNTPGRPLTLFLLDLCFSGAVARLPWQSQVPAEELKGWVIAACRSEQQAYDGRFTRAVINVLRAAAAGELDIDPAVEYIPLAAVARAIRQEVNRLAERSDALRQRVTASLVDLGDDPRLPFFRNPAHVAGGRVRLRASLDPGLLPFLDDLDEGLDARHFLDRAMGVAALGEHAPALTGCFSGREREMRLLSPWLNGVGTGSTAVVTGSPGAGKSALLGVLVCAAHPSLREATKAVWDRVAQVPLPLPLLAAVHARRRGQEEVTRSIAAQLGLGEVDSPAQLFPLLTALPEIPVLVVDALDEAEEAARITERLLLPLTASVRRPDGRAAVRLLVGVRDYPEYAALLAAARRDAMLVDLDQVSADVLADDLNTYVTDLLRTVPGYRRRGGVAGAFAAEVAHALSQREQRNGARGEWGTFLVAGLYTRHLVTQFPDASGLDPAAAEEWGAGVPRDLPGVLELDLADDTDRLLRLRPLLAALAHARGDGMPLAVLTRVAGVLGDPTTVAAVRENLAEAKFYLRQSAGTDGTTVYRLFHQGLADHLTRHPVHPAGSGVRPAVPAGLHRDMLDALLEPLGPAGARDWAAAEPYVCRHALELAAECGALDELLGDDPGFLLLPGVAAQIAGLDRAADSLREFGRLLAEAASPAAPGPAALAAARVGLPELARRIACATSEGQPWYPRWALGQESGPGAGAYPWQGGLPDRLLNAARTLRQDPDRVPVFGIVLSDDGHRTVAHGATGALWLYALSAFDTGTLLDPDGAGDGVLGIDPRGRFLAYRGRGGALWVADLAASPVRRRQKPLPGNSAALALGDNGTRIMTVERSGEFTDMRDTHGPVRTPFSRPATAWSLLVAPRPVAVSGEPDGTVRRWEVPRASHSVLWRHGSPVAGVAVADAGNAIASFDDSGEIRLSHRNSPRSWRPEGRPTALALSRYGSYLALGFAEGAVRLYDCRSGDLLDETDLLGARVTSVAVDAAGRIIVAGGGDGTVRAHLRRETVASPPAPASPRTRPFAVCRRQDGQWTALIGRADGAVDIVDPATGRRLSELAGGPVPVQEITVQSVAGRELARIERADGRARLWDPDTARPVTAGDWPGFARAAQAEAQGRAVLIGGRLQELAAGADGSVLLQEAGESYGQPAVLGAHAGKVTALACAQEATGAVGYSGGDDNTVRVWDLPALRQAAVLRLPGPVTRLQPAGDGAVLVGCGDEVALFLRAQEGAE